MQRVSCWGELYCICLFKIQLLQIPIVDKYERYGQKMIKDFLDFLAIIWWNILQIGLLSFKFLFTFSRCIKPSQISVLKLYSMKSFRYVYVMGGSTKILFFYFFFTLSLLQLHRRMRQMHKLISILFHSVYSILMISNTIFAVCTSSVLCIYFVTMYVK